MKLLRDDFEVALMIKEMHHIVVCACIRYNDHMNNELAINLGNPAEVRRTGISALSDALGPAEMTIFLQQFESGVGDYTKEKYEQPNIPLDVLATQLCDIQ